MPSAEYALNKAERNLIIMTDPNAPIYSVNDIMDAYANYDKTPETEEIILYFISELTGLSVDALSNL